MWHLREPPAHLPRWPPGLFCFNTYFIVHQNSNVLLQMAHMHKIPLVLITNFRKLSTLPSVIATSFWRMCCRSPKWNVVSFLETLAPPLACFEWLVGVCLMKPQSILFESFPSHPSHLCLFSRGTTAVVSLQCPWTALYTLPHITVFLT